MTKPFEVVEHTADIGIQVSGETREALFRNAALGMMSLIVDVHRVRPDTAEMIRVEGGDNVDLLVNWLSELLFRFDARQRVYSEFEIEPIKTQALTATVRGEDFGPDRHRPDTEIKAVTYHEACVEESDRGWRAYVLFDV